MKNGMLVRVGIDSGDNNGRWNGPVDTRTGEFVYVPVIESESVEWVSEKAGYQDFEPMLDKMGSKMPDCLKLKCAHLDPDFRFLTFGDGNQRGAKLSKLKKDDLIVFYASFRDVNPEHYDKLIYAIIGVYIIHCIRPVYAIPESEWHTNAHTRITIPMGCKALLSHKLS